MIEDFSLTSGDFVLFRHVPFANSFCVRVFGDFVEEVLLFIPSFAPRLSPIEGVFSIVKRNDRPTGQIAEAFGTRGHIGAHIVFLLQVLRTPRRPSLGVINKCINIEVMNNPSESYGHRGQGSSRPDVARLDKENEKILVSRTNQRRRASDEEEEEERLSSNVVCLSARSRDCSSTASTSSRTTLIGKVQLWQ